MRIKLIGFEKYDVIFAMKTINVKMEIGNDKKTRKIVQRNTSIEILRFFCMIYIVAYHVMCKTPIWEEDIYRAISLIFHVGVPAFILISGYYQIKFNLKSLCRFLGLVIFYILILYAINLYFAVPTGNIFYALTPFSHAMFWDLWFISCYLFMYLLSPFYNKFINEMSNNELLLLVLTMGVINYYWGWLFNAPSLAGGKNLLNFLLIYTVGTLIYRYKKIFVNVLWKRWLAVYVLLNAFIVLGYLFLPFGREIWYSFFFNYDAPGTLINAISLFMVFRCFCFTNKRLNDIFKSTFAIYIIHANCIVVPLLCGFFYTHFYSDNVLLTLIYAMCFSVSVCWSCVFIDVILRKVHQYMSDMVLFKALDGMLSVCKKEINRHF